MQWRGEVEIKMHKVENTKHDTKKFVTEKFRWQEQAKNEVESTV